MSEKIHDSVNEDFIYEDYTSIDKGLEQFQRRQHIVTWKKTASVFSRYARYVFIGAIVLGILAILLAYAWHLMKKERIVIQEKIIVKEMALTSNNSNNTIKTIDGKKISMMSNVTHFTHVYDQRVGSTTYDIITRWTYDNASNAKLGSYPDRQTCYADFKRNSMDVRLELYEYKRGNAEKIFTNSDLKRYGVSREDAKILKKYCQWHV